MDLGPAEILIVLLIILLLFGGTKLPQLARSLGQAKKEFERGQQGGAYPESPEEPTEDEPGLSASTDELADAVLDASRVLVAVAARSLAAAPSDVTLPQYRVLVILATRGPQRPSDLAAEVGVAASSITRMCDRLVRKKLVRRRLRPSNRREYVVDITRCRPADRRCRDERSTSGDPAAGRTHTRRVAASSCS